MKIHSKTLTNTSDENKQNISELNKHIKYKQKLKKKFSILANLQISKKCRNRRYAAKIKSQ